MHVVYSLTLNFEWQTDVNFSQTLLKPDHLQLVQFDKKIGVLCLSYEVVEKESNSKLLKSVFAILKFLFCIMQNAEEVEVRWAKDVNHHNRRKGFVGVCLKFLFASYWQSIKTRVCFLSIVKFDFDSLPTSKVISLLA